MNVLISLSKRILILMKKCNLKYQIQREKKALRGRLTEREIESTAYRQTNRQTEKTEFNHVIFPNEDLAMALPTEFLNYKTTNVVGILLAQPVFLFHGIDLWFCGWPWSPLEEGDEGCIGPIGKLLCISKTKNIMQYMHGNIPYNTFDCCANQVVHLLLLKSSMGQCKVIWTRQHNIRQVKKTQIDAFLQ